jgi:hypothetical protein
VESIESGKDSTESGTWFYWKWHSILLKAAHDSTESGTRFPWKW